LSSSAAKARARELEPAGRSFEFASWGPGTEPEIYNKSMSEPGRLVCKCFEKSA